MGLGAAVAELLVDITLFEYTLFELIILFSAGLARKLVDDS
jgi:hypothetical protein